METGTEKKKSGFIRTAGAIITASALVSGVFYAGYQMGNGETGLWAGPVTQSQNFVQTAAVTGEREVLDSYSDVYRTVKDSVVSILVEYERQANPNNYSYEYFGPFGNMMPDLFPELNPRSNPGMNPETMPGIVTQGAGSGIIFGEDDENIYVVTNYHVVDGASSCNISLDDEKMAPASYLGGDSISDIAVVSVKKADLESAGITGYTVAYYGDSDAMEIGDQVLAVGNANGGGKSATEGIVSAIDKPVSIDGTSYSAIQTSAAINRGNSGGALVNMAGEVIGINAAKLASVEGVGYAIPSNTVVNLVESIMGRGTGARAFLGITGGDFEYAGEGGLDLPVSGVQVAEILEGGAAQAMGIQPYDIIVGFNGEEITSMTQLKGLIDKTPAETEVEIEIVRLTYSDMYYGAVISGSETLTLNGALGAYPEASQDF